MININRENRAILLFLIIQPLCCESVLTSDWLAGGEHYYVNESASHMTLVYSTLIGRPDCAAPFRRSTANLTKSAGCAVLWQPKELPPPTFF